MGSSPAISILLPTHDGELYLVEQLDSILAQSWDDFELLIVDDGSLDSTVSILHCYAQFDKRIQLIKSTGRKGQKRRLVELLSLARAPVIGFSDQDDIWHPHKLERLAARLNGACLAFGRSELIDSASRSLGRTLLSEAVNRRLLADCPDRHQPGDHFSVLFSAQVSGHALLAHRQIVTPSAFERDQPYDWLISLNAELSGGIAYENDAIIYHRIHGVNSHNFDAMWRDNPLRIRSQHISRAISRAKRRFPQFIDRLEFLAASHLACKANRELFGGLVRKCHEAAGSNTRARLALRRELLTAFRPFTSQRVEWQAVVDHVTAMTLGLFHPFTMSRLKRLL